jgi:hypothetical protein
MYLVTDALNDYCEQPYDTNNVYQVPVNIAQSPAADLQTAWFAPAEELVAGDEPELSALITNVGDVAPNDTSWRDIIYMVSDINPEDTVYQEKYNREGPLSPMESYTLPDPFLVPLEVEPGFYKIGVCSDDRNEVWENESENNNKVLSETIQVTIDSSRSPDLKAETIASVSWQTGETFTVEISASNQGMNTGVSSWVDELYITNLFIPVL